MGGAAGLSLVSRVSQRNSQLLTTNKLRRNKMLTTGSVARLALRGVLFLLLANCIAAQSKLVDRRRVIDIWSRWSSYL